MVLRGISTSFDALSPCERQVAHALLTRPPLELLWASSPQSPLDLHVLGTPPAFVLSQDQTLAFDSVLNPEVFPSGSKLIYELTVFSWCDSWKSHLAFFLILYRFQGSVPCHTEWWEYTARIRLCQHLFWHFLELLLHFHLQNPNIPFFFVCRISPLITNRFCIYASESRKNPNIYKIPKN